MNLATYLGELNKWYDSIAVDYHSEPVQIVKQIEQHLGLTFVPELIDSAQSSGSNVCMTNSPEVRDDYKQTFTPIDLLDYIYAVLHSPSYRKKYNEFLKIDFSGVPYPTDLQGFWNLVGLGGELRQLHLLERPKVEDFITSYPIDGSNEITTKIGKTDWELVKTQNELGRIWINGTQYFDKIPLATWEFYIDGDQPAQKWLKDRKGKTLNYDDILHYQKIIVALTETHRLMQDIASYKIN
jgi:predicted helicase